MLSTCGVVISPSFFLLPLPCSPSPQQDNYGDRSRDNFGCGAVKLYRENENATNPIEFQAADVFSKRTIMNTLGKGIDIMIKPMTAAWAVGKTVASKIGRTERDHSVPLHDHRFKPFPRKKCDERTGKSCKKHKSECEFDHECVSGLCYKSWHTTSRTCHMKDFLKNNKKVGWDCYRDWECGSTDTQTEAYCHTKFDTTKEKAENACLKKTSVENQKHCSEAKEIHPGTNAPVQNMQTHKGKCRKAKKVTVTSFVEGADLVAKADENDAGVAHRAALDANGLFVKPAQRSRGPRRRAARHHVPAQRQDGLELRLLGTTPKERGIARRRSTRGDGDGLHDHRYDPYRKEACDKSDPSKSCKKRGDHCSSDIECESGVCYKWPLGSRKCVKEDFLQENIQVSTASKIGGVFKEKCYRDWQCRHHDEVTELYCHTNKFDGEMEKAESANKYEEIHPGVNAPEIYKQFDSGTCKKAKIAEGEEDKPQDDNGVEMDEKTTKDFNVRGPTTVIQCSDVVPAMMSVLAKKVEHKHDWSKYCVIKSTTMGDPHGFWNYDWRRRNGAWWWLQLIVCVFICACARDVPL